MFAKLLKHEFNAVRKSFFPLCIAALLSAVVGYFLMLIATSQIEIKTNAVLESLARILQGSIYLFLFIFVIGCTIYLYYRFYKTKFTDEGYLTFTLPASTHQILLSSILNMIIWFAIIIAVFFVCLFLLTAPIIASIEDLFYYIQAPTESSRLTPVEKLVTTLHAVCSLSYGLILPLFSITLGSLLAKKHKLLAAFGIGYLINMGISFISSIFMIYEISSDTWIYGEYYFSISTIITSLLCLALAVAGYFIMHHIVKHKLNI